MEDTITYQVHVTGTPTDRDDEEVPGIYLVEVDVTDLTETQIRGAVLDEFHDHIGIAVLEDFEIEVLVPLDDDGTYEPGECQSQAEFAGKLG